jgi:phospholipid/cholesterol/gamma-HCH transport system substrate-binding protein
MALFRRNRTVQSTGMGRFKAGLIAIVVIAVFSYFGFTKANPFADPYMVTAMFKNADDITPKSPVRIAGIEVGKVKTVQSLEGTETGAKVTMEVKENALPIHEDATLKVRPRIFLEGNKFIELKPGSPTAPVLDEDDVIPIQQTFASVQFGDILTSLQKDTREDLQSLLKEYSASLKGKGAKGFNESIKYWEPAYKNTSLVNDATLGQEPTRDLQRVLRGQQKTFAALVENEDALKGLVTNLNVTAGAFAREDAALERSVPALRDTLRSARPALFSVNNALPSLRRFAVDALPGVRSTPATLDAATPFIRQARLLFRRSELRGAAKVLRGYTPTLVRLNQLTVPVLDQGRALSACTSGVLVPFANAPIPMPEIPGIDGQTFATQSTRGLVGLSGESRNSDANLSYFYGQATPPPMPGVSPFLHPSGNSVRPAPPPDAGRQPPAHRPDVPCETQEPPNLNAPGGPASAFSNGARRSEFSGSDRRKMRQLYERALEENQDLREQRSRLRSEGKKRAAADPNLDVRAIRERDEANEKRAKDAEGKR